MRPLAGTVVGGANAGRATEFGRCDRPGAAQSIAARGVGDWKSDSRGTGGSLRSIADTDFDSYGDSVLALDMGCSADISTKAVTDAAASAPPASCIQNSN